VPLVGVLFAGWSVATILVAYWLENGVVGILNVPKILIAGSGPNHPAVRGNSTALAMFFVVHYGFFWLVHGVFVFVLVAFASSGFDSRSIAFMAVLLLISHGTSLVVNYIGRGEYARTTPAAQMFQPYGRLIILHVTIVIGFFFVIFLGQPVALVALLVLFKTIGDLALHLRERARTSPPVLVT
jgi:hypothetical protein